MRLIRRNTSVHVTVGAGMLFMPVTPHVIRILGHRIGNKYDGSHIYLAIIGWINGV